LVSKKVYKGTYSEAMRMAFGLNKDQWTVVYAPHDKFPVSLDGIDALVIGGSFHDPINKSVKPWMRKTFDFIKLVSAAEMPILGICGGLQFTVRAFGGEVIRNPKGREFGTINLDILSAGAGDKLFSGLPKSVFAQSSHKCMANSLKPGWKLLASSKLCRNQAVAIGKNIRLLQFHPEMTAHQLLAIAKYKKEPASPSKDASLYGKKIIHNFLEYFVLPYHRKKMIK